MLLKPISKSTYTSPEPLYNPLNNFSQTELMEKFNLAFYEAQAITKTDIIETFNDFQDLGNENNKSADDYLIDYLISEDSGSSPRDCDINFDFNDFVEDFDQNVRESFSDSTTVVDFDNETFTTDSSKDYGELESTKQFSNFFVPPPIWTMTQKEYELLEDNCNKSSVEPQTPTKSNDFDDIGLYEVLSNTSLDISDWPTDIQDLDEQGQYSLCLPPVGTITKNNFDFNCYVRNIPADEMGYFKQDTEHKNEFGHLFGTEARDCADQRSSHMEQNHMVLSQSDALLNDDPLLSSSNNFYDNQIISDDQEPDNKCDIKQRPESRYQCKWENCYQKCHSQTSLVSHIEKNHVEIKRGDEFTCYWEYCPRKTKPFNARYKLLIHMRVHSGEKPNKCPFKGCNKAFSRLENLKIHQRSHTGERPYLCQFTGCSKCFSNSSDRAKHQRTHFDTKPYACQVSGCLKKYTDPSSLRKHVKNHSHEEQLQIKKKSSEEGIFVHAAVKQFMDSSRQKAVKTESLMYSSPRSDHTYSSITYLNKYVSVNVKQDLKNKIEKNKIKRAIF